MMKIQKKVIVIVGAYSTGSYYAPNFIARGYQCVHVQPQPHVPDYISASYRPNDFIKNIIWNHDIDEILTELAEFEVKFVLPGAEIGVLLADRISHELNLTTTNNIVFTMARRDKYKMHEALQAIGVPSLKHFKTNKIEYIFNWMTKNAIDYPVVLKPLTSAGTDNVHICEDKSVVIEAFNQIIQAKNAFSHANQEVLVQEFLKGDEYVVNTISHDGKHCVTDMIKVNKKIINGAPVYDFAQLISPLEDSVIYHKLSHYTFSVLDALGIKYGPGHSELMMEIGKQPILIEIAARPIGGIDLSAYTEALGYNQISATVESYLNPTTFFNMINTIDSSLRNRLICVFLISPLSGNICSQPEMTFFKDLKTFHSIVLQDTGILEKTSSLINCPGFVNLIADDIESLKVDYQLIRKYEPLLFSQLINKFE